jgi:hypothetical protein
MHKARAFFYVCAGLFLLALSYHLGARNAGAQAGSMVTGFVGTGSIGTGQGDFFVLTPNGDVYARHLMSNGANGELVYVGNFWGAPTPTQQESWGRVKSRYRGERGGSQPATQDR